MSSPMSFYIPIIYSTYSEEDIKQIFGLNIGKVSRVDFAPATRRPGQGVNVINIIRSAYVYISCFYRTRLAENIKRTVFGAKRGFRFTVAPREYWVLLENHNPIPSCDQNIHQLAERLCTVEAIVSSQRQQIYDLKKEVITQANYSHRIVDVIIDLLKDSCDGPFPDMENIHSQYNYIQFGKRYSKRWLLDENDDGDTINQARKNDVEIDDDEKYYYNYDEVYCSTIDNDNDNDNDDEEDDCSTINSELIANTCMTSLNLSDHSGYTN